MKKINSYNPPHHSTVFDPRRIDKHIKTNPCRAIAIFDIVSQLIAADVTPIEQARAALLRQQPEQAAHLIHNLKSSVGNLGGMRVCDIANDLERLLDGKSRPPIVHSFLDSLEREFVLFLKAAHNWLDSRKERYQKGPLDRMDSNGHLLIELKQYLSDSNLKALEIFGHISEALQSSLVEEDFNVLDQAMQNLNFSLALEYIEHYPNSNNALSQ